MAMPAPAPTVAQPNLSDAITQLKAGNRGDADAMMRQIVGLPPTGSPQQGLRPSMQPYQPGQMAAQLSPVQQQAAQMGLQQQAMQQQLAQQAAQMEANKRMAQQAMQGGIGQLGAQPMVNPQSSDALKQQFLAQQAAQQFQQPTVMGPMSMDMPQFQRQLGMGNGMATQLSAMQQAMQQGMGQLGPQPMVNPQSNDAMKQQFLAQQGIFQPMPAYQDPRQLGRTMEQAATAMMQPQQPMGQQAPFGGPQQQANQIMGGAFTPQNMATIGGNSQQQPQNPFARPMQQGPTQSPPSQLGSGGPGMAQTPAMTQQPQPAQQGTQRPQGPFGRLGGASGGRSGLF